MTRAAGVIALLAAACSRPGEAPPAAAGAALRLAQVGTVTTLDPARSGWAVESRVMRQLGDGLVDVDADLQLRAALADSWEVLDGGRTFRFRLREGATMGDGRPLRSADVAASFAHLAEPGQLNWTAMADVEGAEAYHEGKATGVSGISSPDPRTIVFRLKTASSRFVYQLAMPMGLVFGSGSAEDHDRGRVAGTGPFRLEAWEEREQDGVRLQRLRFGARPGRLPGSSHLREMRWDLYSNAPELARGIARQPYDVVYAPASNPQAIARALPGHRVRRGLRLAFLALYFDCGKPPLDRPEARRAIVLAVDRDTLGGEGVLPGFNLPGAPGVVGEEAAIRRDPAAAAALARRAGLDPGRPTRLRVAYSASAEYGDLAPFIRGPLLDALGPLGLRVEPVEARDGRALDERFFAREDHAYLYGSTPEIVDPCFFFEPFRSGNLTSNWSWYSRREVDDAYRECARSMDVLAQRAAVLRALPLVAADAPLLPLTLIDQQVYVHPRVAGFVPTPLDGLDLRNVTLGPEVLPKGAFE